MITWQTIRLFRQQIAISALASLPFKRQDSRGFTIVEVVVTVAITGIFLAAAVQWYAVVVDQRAVLQRQSIAYDLATTNLQKFPTRPSISTTCATSFDLASFFTAETTTTYPNLSQLSSPTQTVTAYPVDGCNGTSFNSSVLKLVSTVTYSGGGGSASSVAYVQ